LRRTEKSGIASDLVSTKTGRPTARALEGEACRATLRPTTPEARVTSYGNTKTGTTLGLLVVLALGKERRSIPEARSSWACVFRVIFLSSACREVHRLDNE
jgi:hypothetical protein